MLNKHSVNTVTIINLISTFLLQAIAFFTIPIFSKILGAENFGYYSTFESWVKIIVSAMGLGVFSTLGPGKYKYKDTYYQFCSSTLIFGTIIGIMMVLFGCLFSPILSKIFKFNQYIIALIFIEALGYSIVNFAQNVYCFEKKAIENLILSVTLSLSIVFLSIVLIGYCSERYNYIGRIIGNVVPYVIIAFIVGFRLYRRSPTGVDFKYCKYNISVGIPTVFHSLSQNILSQSDRVMMLSMGVLNSQIGIYSLFYTLTSVLGTILNAFNNSWCPFYYDYIEANDWKKIRGKSKNYIELFSVLVVGFILLSREISYLMSGKEYWSGIEIIPILSVAIYFTFMYQFPVNFEFYYGKTKIIAIGTIMAGIANIGLNFFLIPIGGMYGAAIATVISYALLFVLHNIIVHKLENSDYDLKISIFFPGLAMVFGGIIAFYGLKNYGFVRWLIGISMGILELIRIHQRKSIF